MQRAFSPLQHLLGSVRVRLMLWYMAATTLVLLLFCGILSLVIAHLALRTLDESLRATTRQLALTYEHTHQLRSLDPSMSALSKDGIAVLFSSHDTIIQTLGPVPPDLLQQFHKELPVSGEIIGCSLLPATATESMDYHLLSMGLLDQHQQHVWLVVGFPRTDQRVSQYLLLGIGVAIPLLLLATALCGYWLATRAMRPVRIMAQMAREIGVTDLSRRLQIDTQDELGELAATIDEMLSRLEETFKHQRQFIADASHELRTPLAIMELALHRALTQDQEVQEHLQALQTIQCENVRMNHLVNDLLLLASTDANHNQWQKEPVDLSEITLDVIERLMPQATRSGIACGIGTLPELWVAGERMALTSVLCNLIENALKYTAGVGKQILVESGSEGAQWAWVRVQDDGPGIPTYHLPYVFDRFYRSDQARSTVTQDLIQEENDSLPITSGSGLGLSIVHSIVQAHHGEVRVSSEIGHGSIFEVWLPLLKGRDDNP